MVYPTDNFALPCRSRLCSPCTWSHIVVHSKLLRRFWLFNCSFWLFQRHPSRDVFTSSSSLPSVPHVPATTAAADTVKVVKEFTPGGRDVEVEALLVFCVSVYIIGHAYQINSRRFRPTRFDGAKPQVQDEAALSQNTAVCAWLERWNHWSFKRASFFRVTDPTADTPFDRCIEKRRCAEKPSKFIAESRDGDNIFFDCIPHYQVSYPFDRLWFINETEFWWRILAFKVHRPIQNVRR